MKQNQWLILLSSALLLVLCCCVAAWGVAGFLWWNTLTANPSSASSLVAPEPGLALDLVLRQPTPAERKTAHLLAHSTIPERDLVTLAQRTQGISKYHIEASSDSPPDYELGNSLSFWIHDVRTNSDFTTTAILRYETPHAYWWIEEGYDIPAQDLKRSAQKFENRTYPTSHRYFGSEWTPGIDGDPRIYIFLGSVPGVGGYFSAPDEYSSQVRPQSNEHEMFYINLENAVPGDDYFDGILAHEFQHMIHWAMDRNEDTWVNEGLSELAAQVSGFDVGGSDYAFSQDPDTQLTTWTKLEDSGPHYGASYLFLAYFLERFGEDAIQQLVAEPANGIIGFDAVLNAHPSSPGHFEALFADWLIANYLDDPSLTVGHYGYDNLEIEQPSHAAEHRAYPVRQRATVEQYAADYILLEGRGDLTIEFTGTLVVPLVGNQTHSGKYQWWSNRGDDGDATLTQAFDLSELEQATLQAWMWYDLEADYDYAYVAVSTDGGQTWDLLANEHTTTTNPSGNSYGPGFTGTSGGDDEPHWVWETFDLTPYAGQPVLIRFEVITDEALNYPGLCLDDISIPELGYDYDAEEEADLGRPDDALVHDGWQAEGWVRVTDHIPQEFLVQLITIGRETQVQRIALNEQMRGTLTVTGLGQDIDRAVLVVSARAPVTTEPAAYGYQITKERNWR